MAGASYASIFAFTETFPDAGEYDPDMSYPGDFLHLFKKAGGIRVSEEALEDIQEIMVKMRKEFHNIYPYRLQEKRSVLVA